MSNPPMPGEAPPSANPRFIDWRGDAGKKPLDFVFYTQ